MDRKERQIDLQSMDLIDHKGQSTVSKQSLEIEGSGGCPLLVREWLPKGDLKACLHILHGMAEHSKRYDGFATWMAEAGYAVWVHDHRQHGYSVLHHTFGVYDKGDTWEAMQSDVGLVQEEFQRRFPNVPMTILGHSMGSILLRSYLQNNKTKVKAAVIMGTPVTAKSLLKAAVMMGQVIGKVAPYKASSLMDNLSVGRFNKDIDQARTPYDWISHDRQTVDRYADDPMCGYAYNAAFYKELSRGVLDANDPAKMAKFPKIPALMISGLEDPCGAFGDGVQKIGADYQGKGVRLTMKLMKHMRHEVLNETNKEATYKEVLRFLDSL